MHEAQTVLANSLQAVLSNSSDWQAVQLVHVALHVCEPSVKQACSRSIAHVPGVGASVQLTSAKVSLGQSFVQVCPKLRPEPMSNTTNVMRVGLHMVGLEDEDTVK